MASGRGQMSKKILFIFCLAVLAFLSAFSVSQADTLSDALDSLADLRQKTECCITRKGYLDSYAKTREVVDRLAGEFAGKDRPQQADEIFSIMKHYQTAAFIMQHHHTELICADSLQSSLKKTYPEAGRDFDQGGAVMADAQGKNCLAPQLLVPIIFRRAAQEFDQLKKGSAQTR